jgi:hypothetical protein
MNNHDSVQRFEILVGTAQSALQKQIKLQVVFAKCDNTKNEIDK